MIHSSRHIVIASLFVELVLAGSPGTAADPAWRTKHTAQWTEEDAQQILRDSPWVKKVSPILLHKQSEDERRAGGNMGDATGLGFDGIADNQSMHAERHGIAPLLLLRWETAMPVRVATMKAHAGEPPTLDPDCYALALYGVPGMYFKGDPLKLGKPLAGLAYLRRPGKPDVKPTRVEVFQSDSGPVVVYEFAPTLEIGKDDQSMSFSAVVGRLSFTRVFDVPSMRFEGKLEY